MLVSKLKKITPTPIKILKRRTFNYFENNFISTYGSKDKDLFIGPWLGDVGKELMYWIPYVRKMNKDGKLLFRKAYAVSRGGVEEWYGGLADGYVEILDHIDTNFYRQPFEIQQNRNSGKEVPGVSNFGNEGQNQFKISDIERKIISDYALKNNISKYEIFHPSVMWKNSRDRLIRDGRVLSLQEIDAINYWEKCNRTTEKYSKIVDKLDLPDKFVASKFYFHPTNLLETEENKIHINKYINKLSKTQKIVDLSAPLSVDESIPHILDHDNKNIINVPIISQDNINLGIQTEIIRRSEGFVGTWGGVSVLPALLGKPHIGFFSGHVRDIHPDYCYHNLLFTYLYEELNDVPIKLIDIKKSDLLGNLF